MARFVAGMIVGLAVGLVASAKPEMIVTSDIGESTGSIGEAADFDCDSVVGIGAQDSLGHGE